MPGPPFNQFVNLLAASRKSRLIPFGLFNGADNLSFIYDIPQSIGVGSYTPMTGTVDGANRVFTSPITVTNGLLLYLNGILQDPAISYGISGNTVTFVNAPQVGDDVTAVVS